MLTSACVSRPDSVSCGCRTLFTNAKKLSNRSRPQSCIISPSSATDGVDFLFLPRDGFVSLKHFHKWSKHRGPWVSSMSLNTSVLSLQRVIRFGIVRLWTLLSIILYASIFVIWLRRELVHEAGISRLDVPRRAFTYRVGRRPDAMQDVTISKAALAINLGISTWCVQKYCGSGGGGLTMSDVHVVPYHSLGVRWYPAMIDLQRLFRAIIKVEFLVHLDNVGIE